MQDPFDALHTDMTSAGKFGVVAGKITKARGSKAEQRQKAKKQMARQKVQWVLDGWESVMDFAKDGQDMRQRSRLRMKPEYSRGIYARFMPVYDTAFILPPTGVEKDILHYKEKVNALSEQFGVDGYAQVIRPLLLYSEEDKEQKDWAEQVVQDFGEEIEKIRRAAAAMPQQKPEIYVLGFGFGGGVGIYLKELLRDMLPENVEITGSALVPNLSSYEDGKEVFESAALRAVNKIPKLE